MLTRKKAKLIVGVSKVDEIEYFSNLGVDEFYAGMIASPEMPVLNHRTNDGIFNFNNIDDLVQAIDLAHQFNKKIFLVINRKDILHFFIDNILNTCKYLVSLDLDGLIITELALLRAICNWIQEKHISCQVHVSSLATSFNSYEVQFYKNLGVNRVIFPKWLQWDDAQSIILSSDIETEIFFPFANGCHHVEGFCNLNNCVGRRNLINPSTIGEHYILAGNACAQFCKRHSNYLDRLGNTFIYAHPNISFADSIHRLFHFVQAGGTAVKLPFRGAWTFKKNIYIQIIGVCLDLAMHRWNTYEQFLDIFNTQISDKIGRDFELI